jgi:hypothetical protein
MWVTGCVRAYVFHRNGCPMTRSQALAYASRSPSISSRFEPNQAPFLFDPDSHMSCYLARWRLPEMKGAAPVPATIRDTKMMIDNAGSRAGAAMLGLVLLSPLQAGFPEPHLVEWHDPDTFAELDTTADGAAVLRWDGSDEDPEVLAERRRLEAVQKGHGGLHYTAVGGGTFDPTFHPYEYSTNVYTFALGPRTRNASYDAQIQLPHGARLRYLDFWGSNGSPSTYTLVLQAKRVCHPHLSAGVSHFTLLGERTVPPSTNSSFFTTISLIGGATGELEIDNRLCVYWVSVFASGSPGCIGCTSVHKVRAEWRDPD